MYGCLFCPKPVSVFSQFHAVSADINRSDEVGIVLFSKTRILACEEEIRSRRSPDAIYLLYMQHHMVIET